MGVLVDSIYERKICVENLVIFMSVLHISIVCEGLRCEGFYKDCCPGFSWNSKSQQCEACIPGNSGLNCSIPCPYPFYGVDCQKSCNCIEDMCDVSTGCMNYNKDNETTAAWSTMRAEESNKVTAITKQNQPYSEMPNSSTITMSTDKCS